MVNSQFTDAIANAFYDKEFTLRKVTHTLDAEGGATTSPSTEATQLGNVQFTLNARSIETYGITAKIDIAVTADKSLVAAIDDHLVYNGTEYVVSDVKYRDSHVLIVGTRR